MAVAEQENSQNGGGGVTSAALKAAADAAATGAATYAVKKVRSHDSGSKHDDRSSTGRWRDTRARQEAQRVAT